MRSPLVGRTLGGLKAALRSRSVYRGSTHLDVDALGLGLGVLGQMHFQHTVLELGIHFRAIRFVRQRETALKTSVASLHTMLLFRFLLVLELALARNGEDPV